MKCCQVIYWKHDEGWDAFLKEDCRYEQGSWIPNWFDCQVIEDYPTKAAAIKEIQSRHMFGICFVK